MESPYFIYTPSGSIEKEIFYGEADAPKKIIRDI
jgi:hypothetical protein